MLLCAGISQSRGCGREIGQTTEAVGPLFLTACASSTAKRAEAERVAGGWGDHPSPQPAESSVKTTCFDPGRAKLYRGKRERVTAHAASSPGRVRAASFSFFCAG